ncbi:hypothetical protein JL721_12644 [Aureococcus anophagefferens]|nr:hypothetical protein JL721_12644 [Aureococcus anophagefferens]
MAFDGVDDYVEFPSAVTADIQGSNARTICLWAVIDSFSSDGGLFDYGTSSDLQNFALRVAGTDGSLKVQLWAADTDVALSGSDDGDWHHYCLTYDGSTWYLYFDGNEAGSGTSAVNTGSDRALRLGQWNLGDDNDGYLDGSIDEVYVYSSALDAASIQVLYDAVSTAPTVTPLPTSNFFQATLVAHYSSDDGTAADDSDSSLDGTINGATATAGLFGSVAMAFDGVDDYVEFPSAVTADIQGSNARTICLTSRFEWPARTAASKYGWAADTASLSGSDDGDWHHYCVTYDGSAWYLYFDGNEAGSGTSAVNTGSDRALKLGMWDLSSYLDGAIDEVYVYSSALDAASIQVLYDAGSTPAPTQTTVPTPNFFQATLVAHYSFDARVRCADDHVGDGSLDCTRSGTKAVKGRDGSGALSFDGTDDYVDDGSEYDLGAGLFDYGDYSDLENFALRVHGTDGSLRVQLWGADTDVALSGSDDGDWHHYCLTYDGSDWALYFDGTQAATGTEALDTGSDNALRLGQFWNDYFDGSIDEVYATSALDAAAAPSVPSSAPSAAPSPSPSAAPSSSRARRRPPRRRLLRARRPPRPELGAVRRAFASRARAVPIPELGAVRRAVALAKRGAVLVSELGAVRRAVALAEPGAVLVSELFAVRGAVGVPSALPSAGPSPLPSAAPSASPSASPSALPTIVPTASFIEITSMGTESTCVHDVECELLWVYRGDSSACATLTAVFTDPDGNVVQTADILDNDGQVTQVVSGDSTVNEYTLTLTCDGDASVTDSIDFQTADILDNDGQVTQVVSGDATVSEYTLTLTCDGDASVTDSIDFQTDAVAGAGADYVPIPEASSYANGGTMESVSGTNCCADPGSQSSTIAAAYPVAVAKTDAVAVAKTDAVAGAGADDVPIPEASSYANGGTMESVTGTNRCADPGSQSSTIAAAYPVAVAGAEPGSDPAADDPRSKPRSERSAVVGAVLLNPQRPANHVDAHDGRALGATDTADSSYATAEDYCDDYYSARIDEIEEAVVYGYIDEMIARSGSSANDSLASIEAMRPTRAITDVDAVQRTVGAPVDRAEPEAVYVAPNDCFGVSIVEPNTEANCGTFFATDQPASDVETVREADAATDARTVSTAGEPQQSAGSGADGDTDDCKPELYAHDDSLLGAARARRRRRGAGTLSRCLFKDWGRARRYL